MLNLRIESADPCLVAPSARYMGECAAALGLPPQSIALLVQAIEASCNNVLTHAYQPGEDVRYQLAMREEPGALVVGIQDRGLPFDEARLHPGIRQLVDQVRLVSLGREGKRLELSVNLHSLEYEAHLTESDKMPEKQLPPAPDNAVTIRPARDEDAIPIARCVYRCYGSTYRSEYLYNSEKLRGLWKSGQITSVVAVTTEGELIGHLCYWVDSAEDKVGESTDAVVDPRYRGRHLFDQLKSALVVLTRQQGRYGMVSEAVTVHPYSQKGVLATGAIETGLMLGNLPSDLQFRAIGDGKLPARQSCMLCYLKLNHEPERTVFLPSRHAPMLHKTYERVGLRRNFGTPTGNLALAEHGQLEVHLDEGWAEAALRVVTYGQDIGDLFRSHMRHLLANGIPYIYAELPLGEEAVDDLVNDLENLGFSYAGLVPELANGDILRLHHLTNIELDLKISVVTDWGAEIRDYVLAQAGPGLASTPPK